MAVELLRREPATSTGETRDLLNTAHEDVMRLEDVGQRLLDVSRSRAMTIALDRQTVNLSELVGRVMKLFDLQARERGIALEVTTPSEGRDDHGRCDEDQLGRSRTSSPMPLRYTPSGGHVRVETTVANGAVNVSVSDTGAGIPADQRERIFERFVQAVDGGEAGAGPRTRHSPRHRAGARGPHPPRERGRAGEPVHARAAEGVRWRRS
jgi:two-component system sensor histidine kinase ResE